MSIHSDVVTSTVAGATADSFDEVGTVDLDSEASRLLGVWVTAAIVTRTAAEGNQGQLQIESGDLNIAAPSSRYSVGPYSGSDPATNIGFTTHVAEFIPLVHDTEGGEGITVSYATHVPDPTAGSSVVAGVVYEVGGPTPPEVMQRFPDMAALPGGGDSEANAAVTTVAETAITDLVIPAWVTEIVGFKQVAILDAAPTGGEEINGFMRLRSSMRGFEPQEWPFMAAFNAPLGTPVGHGMAYQARAEYMAAYWPTTGKSETITPNAVLVVASGSNLSVSASVAFR